MAFDQLQRIFRQRHDPQGLSIRQSRAIPEHLTAILDRAASERQRLSWDARRQYARVADLPLAVLVARAWGRRFPFVELLAAGVLNMCWGAMNKGGWPLPQSSKPVDLLLPLPPRTRLVIVCTPGYVARFEAVTLLGRTL